MAISSELSRNRIMGLTEKSLADRAGLSARYVKASKLGDNWLSLPKLSRLRQTLGVIFLGWQFRQNRINRCSNVAGASAFGQSRDAFERLTFPWLGAESSA